jgi:hypothetical protein
LRREGWIAAVRAAGEPGASAGDGDADGGDSALAAAGYYQGLPSVLQEGELPSTQQYVEDVLALQRQFGGE